MKKYTTLNIDLTQLKLEGQNYINGLSDSEGTEYRNSAYHWLGEAQDILTQFPSLVTTFSSLNLTPSGMAHRTVHVDAMFNHVAGTNTLIVPIADLGDTTLNVFNVISGAQLQENSYYLDNDCTFDTSVPITDHVFIESSTVHTLQTTSTTLSDFLIIYFSENTDSYFAD